MAKIKNILLIIVIIFLPIVTEGKESLIETSSASATEAIVYDDSRTVEKENSEEQKEVYKPPLPPRFDRPS